MKKSATLLTVGLASLIIPMVGLPCAAAPAIFSRLWNCLKDPAPCFVSTPASAPPIDHSVLARVGDQAITVSDFQARLGELPAAYRSLYLTPRGRREFIDRMVEEKTIVVAARQKGLENNEKYRQEMARFQEGLLRTALMEQVGAIRMADIQKYYKSNRKMFSEQIQYLVTQSHAKTLEEAKRSAALLQTGRPFAALGKGFDQALLTVSSEPHQVPIQEQALTELRKGQVSAPLKVPGGYFVVRKDTESILPAKSLEEATPQIKMQLQNDKLMAWLKTARASISVSVDEKALNALDVSAPAAHK